MCKEPECKEIKKLIWINVSSIVRKQCVTCARSLRRVFNVLVRIVTGRGIWFASRNFTSCNENTQQLQHTMYVNTGLLTVLTVILEKGNCLYTLIFMRNTGYIYIIQQKL